MYISPSYFASFIWYNLVQFRKNGAEMDWGFIVFQLFMLAFLIAFASAVFFAVNSLVARKSAASNVEQIENKLDRIIELLEKQNKE